MGDATEHCSGPVVVLGWRAPLHNLGASGSEGAINGQIKCLRVLPSCLESGKFVGE
jgi:hypothetical protein